MCFLRFWGGDQARSPGEEGQGGQKPWGKLKAVFFFARVCFCVFWEGEARLGVLGRGARGASCPGRRAQGRFFVFTELQKLTREQKKQDLQGREVFCWLACAMLGFEGGGDFAFHLLSNSTLCSLFFWCS